MSVFDGENVSFVIRSQHFVSKIIEFFLSSTTKATEQQQVLGSRDDQSGEFISLRLSREKLEILIVHESEAKSFRLKNSTEDSLTIQIQFKNNSNS